MAQDVKAIERTRHQCARIPDLQMDRRMFNFIDLTGKNRLLTIKRIRLT